jgi:hypothetical protein
MVDRAKESSRSATDRNEVPDHEAGFIRAVGPEQTCATQPRKANKTFRSPRQEPSYPFAARKSNFPAAGTTAIPPSGLFEWITPFAWVEAIQVDLVDIETDTGIDEALFLDNSMSSWSPNEIVPGRDSEFELSFLDLFFIADPRTTDDGRPYLFTSGFQAFNSKFVPEPSGAAVWVAAILCLSGMGRRQERDPSLFPSHH